MANRKFSEILKEVRECSGKFQREVAEHLGINIQSYQKYELGEREPNLERLTKIADFFEVSADYLLGRTDDPKRK